jgi:hypothetical protein
LTLRRRHLAATFVDIGLVQPIPEAALGGPEVLGDIRDRLRTLTGELDGATIEHSGRWGLPGLPQDHLAYFVLDVIAELDLSEFYVDYRDDGRGGFRVTWRSLSCGVSHPGA